MTAPPRAWTTVGATLGKPALLLAGLVAAGLALRTVPIEGLAHFHQGPGVYLVLGAAACAVGVPRQAVAFAGGYAFGLWGGLGLALLATMLGCVADFGWARIVARDWVRRRFMGSNGNGRLGRLDRFLAAHPFSATLTLRLLPVGNNLALNLLAGVSAVRVLPFLTATLIGYLPQTAVFALLGGGVRVAHGVQMAVAVALFVASILLGWLLLRANRALSAAGTASAPATDPG